MEEKILFVDDEENILAAFRRQLRREFSLETANSGPMGLELLSSQGPFAVVVTDFRMPEMDGVQFLKRAKEISPETVRIMLTGFADINTTIDAVNNGNIFRFLTKPCPSDALVQAIYNGLDQYRLIMAERDLLEKTLRTSVTLLIETLSLSNPLAFSRALRIRRIVRIIVSNLKLTNAWQYDMAAMLSQIGCVALPQGVLEKVHSGKPLNKYERISFASHPAIGYRLLANIHRMESIAAMVRDQNKRFDDYERTERRNLLDSATSSPFPVQDGFSKRLDTEPARAGARPNRANGFAVRLELGSQILHIALDYDQLITGGYSHLDAVAALRERVDEYNLEGVAALGEEEIIFNNWTARLVDAGAIEIGMVLNENIEGADGEIIAFKHQEVTQTLLERIRLTTREPGFGRTSSELGSQDDPSKRMFLVYTPPAGAQRML